MRPPGIGARTNSKVVYMGDHAKRMTGHPLDSSRRSIAGQRHVAALVVHYVGVGARCCAPSNPPCTTLSVGRIPQSEIRIPQSVVFRQHFKEGLGMGADRAFIRGFFPFVHVAAIPAVPFYR